MKSSSLNRRDFIKLLGLTPLFFLERPECASLAALDYQLGNLPNILILVFDALTARNMSLYGYLRQTTPKIDQLARSATVYHRHYASGNFTSPGTASLFTGVYPWSHRALQGWSQTLTEFEEKNIFALLAERYNTFAYTHNPYAYVLLNQFRDHIGRLDKISDLAMISDSLAENFFDPDFNIATQAERILRGSEGDFFPGSLLLAPLQNMSSHLKTSQLLEAYRNRFPRGLTQCSLDGNALPPCFLLEEGVDWLMNTLASQPQPFMGYVHFFPPHGPYIAPRRYTGLYNDGWKPVRKPRHPLGSSIAQKQLNTQRRQYDQSIAYVDAEFGRLFEFMQRAGLLENTILILTSDHGEIFERGISGHVSATLFEPLLHIPLLVWNPGQSERQDIHTPTSATDILPSLAQIALQQSPIFVEGEVLPVLGLSVASPERSIFAVEAKDNPIHAPLNQATFAIIKGRYKLVHYRGYADYPEAFELYNLVNDPEELEDIYSPTDALSKTLQGELQARLVSENT